MFSNATKVKLVDGIQTAIRQAVLGAIAEDLKADDIEVGFRRQGSISLVKLTTPTGPRYFEVKITEKM